MRLRLLALLLLALLLAACGGTAAPPSGSPASQASTATSSQGSPGMMTSPGAGMDMGHGMPAASSGMGMMDDQSFLSAMIPHHQMAIAMAQIALERAEHPEIKQLAQNIITSQQAEINQMQTWEHAWFPNATPNASPPMSQHEMGMTMDVNTLKTAQPFDKAFMEGMIPHHQGAIHMSQQVLQTTQRREIQELAHSIIGAQQAEINQMQQWLKAWYG